MSESVAPPAHAYEVGDVYRHVGRGGVPGTGLLVRVVERRSSGFLADYPQTPAKRPVSYKYGSLDGCYVRAA